MQSKSGAQDAGTNRRGWFWVSRSVVSVWILKTHETEFHANCGFYGFRIRVSFSRIHTYIGERNTIYYLLHYLLVLNRIVTTISTIQSALEKLFKGPKSNVSTFQGFYGCFIKKNIKINKQKTQLLWKTKCDIFTLLIGLLRSSISQRKLAETYMALGPISENLIKALLVMLHHCMRGFAASESGNATRYKAHILRSRNIYEMSVSN